jgi:hypothetical protein
MTALGEVSVVEQGQTKKQWSGDLHMGDGKWYDYGVLESFTLKTKSARTI